MLRESISFTLVATGNRTHGLGALHARIVGKRVSPLGNQEDAESKYLWNSQTPLTCVIERLPKRLNNDLLRSIERSEGFFKKGPFNS